VKNLAILEFNGRKKLERVWKKDFRITFLKKRLISLVLIELVLEKND